jgi:hypothetical protein
MFSKINMESLIEGSILTLLVIVIGTLIINRINANGQIAILVTNTTFVCSHQEVDACGMSYFECQAIKGTLSPVQNFRCMTNQVETNPVNLQ